MSGDLWDCYLDNGNSCERFEEEKDTSTAVYTFPQEIWFSHDDDDDSSRILVYESKQHVFSPTGSYVWEASLVLCSYIHFNKDVFLCRVCELGCGTALPSLYISKLLHPNASGRRLYLTDCDVEVLSSLCENLSSHSGISDRVERKEGYRPSIVVDILDWAQQDDSKVLDDCDLIIGCALVYIKNHAIHLSKLIRKFLASATNDSKKSAVILQIGDRSGWDDLILQLTLLRVSFVCEEVSEDVYYFAKNITSHTIKTSEKFQVKQFDFPSETSTNENISSLITTNRKDFVLLKCYSL